MTALSPKEGTSVGDDGTLVAHRLHRHARHSRRLGQRVPRPLGPRPRRPLDGAVAPLPASNGVGVLARELAYLASHTSLQVTLQNGTEPFRGPLLPV